jgi:hypothetical protein
VCLKKWYGGVILLQGSSPNLHTKLYPRSPIPCLPTSLARFLDSPGLEALSAYPVYFSDMSVNDFPPGQFTYGRSSSDEPATSQPRPVESQDHHIKNKAPAKKSTTQAENAFSSFPVITKKRARSDTMDAAAGDTHKKCHVR